MNYEYRSNPNWNIYKNTHLQPRVSVITPPRIGPKTSANANTDPSIPIYLALSLGEKISPTTVNGRDNKIPPLFPEAL